MSDIAIQVEKLGKQYHIGGPQQQFDRIGDQMVHFLKTPLRRAGKLLRGQATGAAELDTTFWALRDISFEIRQGEVVGIIGRNGAGKSTLLKILSRITKPTTGEATIFGRVGSLLEVGTGFHPELTGRENVFLNGAILGMRREEIAQKFDEIVAFAEIEKFIDTPVKHYSSGMYVRLAFSVAAHLEPEVLLVDEVLAVGDLNFQKKCLGKMDDVARAGRTVLFVSHNMGLMQTLCDRGILLQEGRIRIDGTMRDAIDIYVQTLEGARRRDVASRTDRKGQGKTRLVSVEITTPGDEDGDNVVVRTGDPVRFAFQVDRHLPDLKCHFFINDHIGQPLAAFRSNLAAAVDSAAADQNLRFVCDIEELLLVPGRYWGNVVIIGDDRMQDFLEMAVVFDVGPGEIRGRVIAPDQKYSLTMPHTWTVPVV